MASGCEGMTSVKRERIDNAAGELDLAEYDYDLPEDLIAQYPRPRGECRVLVVRRKERDFFEMALDEAIDVFFKGKLVVFNNTRVVRARLLGKRLTGGKSEIFLLRKLGEWPNEESSPNSPKEEKIIQWEALVRPAKKLKEGTAVVFGNWHGWAVIEKVLDEKRRVVSVDEDTVELFGKVPLPPYIKRKSDEVDGRMYQTVFAKKDGSVAAPTASLHFSEGQIDRIRQIADACYVTLHVGWGTFKKLEKEDFEKGRLHFEMCYVSEDSASKILKAKSQGKKVLAVGTTVVRTLESAAYFEGEELKLKVGSFETDLFIKPGYRFKVVDYLFTNFHLPRSSLLALVYAFAGKDLVRKAYKYAISKRFKFFSYGDAMLII